MEIIEFADKMKVEPEYRETTDSRAIITRTLMNTDGGRIKNGMKLYKYLCYNLTEIPFCKNKESFRKLLQKYLEKKSYKFFIF